MPAFFVLAILLLSVEWIGVVLPSGVCGLLSTFAEGAAVWLEEFTGEPGPPGAPGRVLLNAFGCQSPTRERSRFLTWPPNPAANAPSKLDKVEWLTGIFLFGGGRGDVDVEGSFVRLGICTLPGPFLPAG